MSIAANALSELPIGADTPPASSSKKAPPRRRVNAKLDVIQQPEAR